MEPISQEQLEELMKNAPEMDQQNMQEGEEGQEAPNTDELIENLMKELQKRDPQNQQFQQGPMQHVDEGLRAIVALVSVLIAHHATSRLMQPEPLSRIRSATSPRFD